MKYWLLTTEYPPLYGGGISTYCYHTAQMLMQQGHSVTVFVPGDAVNDYAVSYSEQIRMVHFSKDRSNTGSFLGYVPALSYAFAMIIRDFIRIEGKPDCIESQEYLAIPYYLLQFKLLRYPEFSNIPVVLTLHSPAFLYLYYNREGLYEYPNYWTCEMEISCIRCADLIIAPSQYIIDEIKKHTHIDETNVRVIRNPYHFIEAPSVPAVQRNKIVFYGKLSPQKGVFELFGYMRSLWDAGFTHQLTVIGGTDKVYYPEMKTMGQIINQQNAGYIKKGLVTFTGKIPPAALHAYLADAHIVLIPSANDNLPYAAIEAMCLGKVVLASKQGGQAEIIADGVNGFLFDHNDPSSFAQKLQHILALDDATLQAVGMAAMQHMKHLLNYETIAAQKLAVIDRLCRHATDKTIFPFARVTRPLAALAPVAGNRLLSIVIPYFNMGAYIKECVDSALASSYTLIEILIVNDGSTDRQSLDALEQFTGHPSVTIVHKANEGLALTRNYGAKLAKGGYLAFLDADDKVHEAYYTRAIQVLTQYENVFFVGAWVQFFGAKNNVWPTWNPEPPYILLHNSVNSSSLVYKTTAFLSGGLNDKAVDYGIEDYESVINLLHHGYCGVVLPECLFYYRIRNDSMYRSLTRHKMLYSYQYIAGKHAGLYRDYAPEIFNLMNANGPSFAYDNPSFAVSTGYAGSLLNKVKTVVKKYPRLKRILLRVKGMVKV